MFQKAEVSSGVRKGIQPQTVTLNLSEPKKQTRRSKTGRRVSYSDDCDCFYESSHRLKSLKD